MHSIQVLLAMASSNLVWKGITLMVSLLLMDLQDHAGTSGHLQLLYLKLIQTMSIDSLGCVHAPTLTSPGHSKYQHLLKTITSAALATLDLSLISILCMATAYGMVLGVFRPMPAASSTLLRGFALHCQNPQRTILSSGFVTTSFLNLKIP